MSVRHTVRVHPSAERLPRSEQLAWALAQLAADPVEVDPDVVEMIVNRVIDDTAVATASLTRAPVVAARAQAQAHPVSRGGVGATVVGLERSARTSPEWAAWANGVAVRELDFHDTFLAAEYSHPGDTIPPLLAGRDVGQGAADHAGADQGDFRASHRVSPIRKIRDEGIAARSSFPAARPQAPLPRKVVGAMSRRPPKDALCPISRPTRASSRA